jgi:hypothetical protein
VCLADRGFADPALRTHLRRLGGHFRIRIQGSCGVTRPGHRSAKVQDFPLAPGRALFLHHGALTADPFGPVSLA